MAGNLYSLAAVETQTENKLEHLVEEEQSFDVAKKRIFLNLVESKSNL